MGGIISSFLSPDSLRSAFNYVRGQAEYIWRVEDNLKDLETQKKHLIATKECLLNNVKLAEQQPRTRRTVTVKLWFETVDEMVTQVEKLQQEKDQEIDRLCLGNFCSKDLISSYNFGKAVEKLKEEVIKLKKDGEEMKEVYEEVPEDPALELPVEQTVVGQDLLIETVWGFVTDQEKNQGIIGLYGTGGIGKTTLLKQVNNGFRAKQHNFDVVIWAVVSKEPSLEKIQADIGKRIGLSTKSWQEKSFDDKALDITDILRRKRFVLLLDDVWQYINLNDLGVPLQCLNLGSKIVFTTRSCEVCGQMKAAMLEVSLLRDEEAWGLFEEEVGRYALDCHPDVPELAKTMAKECCRLPLALKTVGRAMRSISSIEEWKSKIKILKTSASKFSGMEEVFSRLKFSYDSLPRDERSCLLYCCLFPEDHEIPKTDLIDYWVSEGILDCFDDGYTVIGHLHRACLLEVEGDHVKLHDMIREMALWIACKIEKEEENFLVRTSAKRTDAPNLEEWEGVKRVSLMENQIESLSEIPTCPRLHTLLLNRNPIGEIPDGFFRSMSSLRVLSLRGNFSLTELPSAISSLVTLQHLDLSSTFIRGLPQEMKALVNLRYLNLENTMQMSSIPKQLISGFSKLQVLKMLNCGSVTPHLQRTMKSGSPVEEGNLLSELHGESLIKELLGLKHLKLISLNLNFDVQNFLKYPTLVSITQSLYIRSCARRPLNVLQLANTMEHLKELRIGGSEFEELKIDSTGEVRKVLQSGFCSLHTVDINLCTVKDLTWLTFVPNLKKLNIHMCYDMEEIISVEKLSGVSEILGDLNIFAQLESLYLWNVENLTSIYQNPLPFPMLKTIEVHQCPKLKKLPLNSSSAKEHQIVIEGTREWWEELQWEDEATQNVFSTCFLPSIY